jgi:heme oxygenase
MSLKDLTKEKHTLAEQTLFMQAVFKGTMPKEVWAEYTYNKMLWYGAIEQRADTEGLAKEFPDLNRTFKLYQDFKEMTGGTFPYTWKPAAIEYYHYILNLDTADEIMAHVYTWHMGDLFGGQMIKKMLPVPHRNLEFKDVDTLKTAIYTKLNDTMGEEANRAFDWAIRILREYDQQLNLG